MPEKGLRAHLKPRIQDFLMGFMDELRSETVSAAAGTVLEVGFGTGRNLCYYGNRVQKLIGIDPLDTRGLPAVEERIRNSRFPVERVLLAQAGPLPFEKERFDCIVTTWTLCSIPDPSAALAEMYRVLKPGGRYVFIEHGRSARPNVARWQERVNPIWRRVMDGCNLNRPIADLVTKAGFELSSLDRFQYKGPAVMAQMYRGFAIRS